jgi:hypothetical protein
MKKIILLGVLAYLSACSMTSQQLRAEPKETANFHVDKSFESVRENLITVFKKCYVQNYSTQYGTESHLFPTVLDTTPNEAVTIELIFSGMDRIAYLSIDAFRNSGGGTDITYYKGRFDILRNYRTIIENWATGKDKGCP